VEVEGQVFTVKANPAPLPSYSVASYGCRPNDSHDDVRCIAAAISAAAASGGGSVEFGPGTWEMHDSSVAEMSLDGILVPVGVSLTGTSASTTTILRRAGRGDARAKQSKVFPASFTLLGRNTVQRLRFKEERTYTIADASTASGTIQLGKPFNRLTAADANWVEDVVITHNVFDRPMTAVSSGGLPMRRLIVTHNEFGAFKNGLDLGGNRYNTKHQFHVDDSIVTENVFKPGSYLDAAIEQGSIASQIGAARRLDFSNNVADGASTQYLQDKARDAPGWRAAFFWHLGNSHEMMLVAQNTATCTGDKAGDGEAIAYDNNRNTFAFSSARAVLASSANSVTALGPLIARQEGQAIAIESYYIGHWLRVVEGPGLGQVRRIVSYATQPGGSRITFRVLPTWDVLPSVNSRISVGREFWQVYTVENQVDQRAPTCRKSNRNGPEGGAITLYAQFADSAVDGNRQHDTDGIFLHHSYDAEDRGCATCKTRANFQSFVEVRGNVIDGEYDWMSDCSRSGIFISHSAGLTFSSPSPVVGYGLSISHNSIARADALRGGAIGAALTWHGGPPPHNWRLLESTLIFRNEIRDLAGPTPLSRCDVEQSQRIGINLYEDSLVWDTVLYGNSCLNTSVPLVNRGRRTVLVCPSPVPNSCECGTTD